MIKSKLEALWSEKVHNLEYNWPNGVGTERDALYLASIFSIEFLAELDRMGYNLKTFKFSIKPKEDCERFFESRQKLIEKAKKKAGFDDN